MKEGDFYLDKSDGEIIRIHYIDKDSVIIKVIRSVALTNPADSEWSPTLFRHLIKYHFKKKLSNDELIMELL